MSASLDISGWQPDTYVRGCIIHAAGDDNAAAKFASWQLYTLLRDEGLEVIPGTMIGQRINRQEYQVQCHAREASR